MSRSAAKVATDGAPSVRWMAAFYGVSHTALQNWGKSGVDVFDFGQTLRHVQSLRTKPTGWKGAVDRDENAAAIELDDIRDLETAKLALTIRQAKKVDFQLEVEMARYILAETQREHGVRIGAAVKAAVLRLEADLPPVCEGLSAASMQKKFREAGDQVLKDLADMESDLWKDQSEREAIAKRRLKRKAPAKKKRAATKKKRPARKK